MFHGIANPFWFHRIQDSINRGAACVPHMIRDMLTHNLWSVDPESRGDSGSLGSQFISIGAHMSQKLESSFT